ncbi:MAG: TerB family tellurite resistance protein [Holophagae bacterium]|jgi:uncharacterized tellurite resistance protein B-like protein
MNSFLKKLFGHGDGAPATTSSDTETVRRIVGELDRLDPDEARYLAAFAFVLARVANADSTISADESRRMEQVVREVGGLTEPQAVLVVQIAKAQQQLKGGTENYLVTREFDRIASRAQKEKLLHCLFEISAADDEISLLEENEVKTIANELRFEHKEFSAIRSEYNEQRSILK